MNLNEVISLLQLEQGMPLVTVRFCDDTRAKDNPSASYTYKAAVDHYLSPGDLVLVEVAKDGSSLLKVAEVVARLGAEALQGCDISRLKHVVAKVDLGPYNAVLRAENEVRRQLAMAEVHERLAAVRKFVPADNLISLAPQVPRTAPQAPSTPRPIRIHEALLRNNLLAVRFSPDDIKSPHVGLGDVLAIETATGLFNGPWTPTDFPVPVIRRGNILNIAGFGWGRVCDEAFSIGGTK